MQETALWDLLGESVIASSEGRISGWNLAASALYGWQPHEANGSALADLLGSYPPEAVDALICDGRWEGMLERTRFDGHSIMVRVKCMVNPPGAAEKPAIIEVSSLVDEMHPAEIRLKASEYRYRNLFGAVAASFWELDFSGVGRILAELSEAARENLAVHLADNPELVREMMRATRIVDINQRTLELFGPGTKRQLLAASLEAYWPDASTKDYAASVVAAVSGQPHFVCETRVRSLGGREFDVLFTVSFLPDTVGKGNLLIGVTDISDRVKASQELDLASKRHRMFYEIPSIAISEMDSSRLIQHFEALRREGVQDIEKYIGDNPEFMDFALDALRFVDVNEAAVRIFGAQSREDLIGRSLKGIFEPGRDAFRHSVQANFRGEPVFQTELRMKRLDGAMVDTLFCRVVSEPYDRGKVLAAQIDITEQVRGREELDRLQRQLTHASRISLLGELSASIAHEISQPITAIANSAVAAGRIAQQPQIPQKHLVTLSERILRDAVRAGEIISRIRAMATNRNIELIDVDIERVVSDAHQLVARELRDHEIAISFAYDRTLPTIRGDSVQLQQVMVNLIMNAVQAMEATKQPDRRLRISVVRELDAILVRVTDSGPGFPNDQLDSAIKSFHSTKPHGLGLGLSICRSIIEGHGGRISIANNKSRSGATVTLELPIMASGADDADRLTQASSAEDT